MKKISFLTYPLFKPSTRFRVVPFAGLLRQSGMDAVVRVLSARPLRRYVQLLGLGDSDVVVIQKRLLNPFFLRLLRLRARKLVYDFDDAVMLDEEPDEKGDFLNPARNRRFLRMIRAVDMVIAGNDYLGELALTAGAKKVRIIPSFPSPIKARKKDDGNCVLGWMGSAGNLKYLEAIAPAVKAVMDKCPGLEFRVVTDGHSPLLEEIGAVFKPWSESGEAADLSDFDIGIMPLADNPWTHGKCGFKLLQYFSAARPVVSSPVGVNSQIVRDGVNGFLASTMDQWSERILTLVSDAKLRLEMGREGRSLIESDFCIEKWGPVYRDIIGSL